MKKASVAVKVSKNGRRGGIRIYRTIEDRLHAVRDLQRLGFNYFVGYIDSGRHGRAGLSFGVAEWLPEGQVWVRDVHGLIH